MEQKEWYSRRNCPNLFPGSQSSRYKSEILKGGAAVRKVFLFILCILMLTTAVSAAGSVTTMQSNTTVSSDGSCQISLVLQLSVDGGDGDLRLPLPRDARNISLNGGGAKTTYEDSLRWVDLSSAVYGSGNFTVTVQYSLPDRVTAEKKSLVLTVPLLSGFSYPIERMDFSVTLPGEPEEQPSFTSTYHPESMDTFLNYTVDGSVISGYCLQGIKDHETLTMTLPVSEDLFPQPVVKQWSLSNDDLVQYALTVLAVLYWLIFMRCSLPKRLRRVQAPDGITAGELGCCMMGQGVDFSMTVLSWAKMGYLTVTMDRNRRVLLHKAMDMGNERSEFEVRAFKTLFGKRRTVDGSSEHYGRLGRKVGKTIPGAWHYFRKTSGNPLIFRCLTVLIGAVGGYSLAVGFATDTLWQVILAILLIPFGGLSSWLMQMGARGIYLRHRRDLFIALGYGLLWLILGNWSGQWNVAIYIIVTQFAAGLASVLGGRRTEAGLQARNEIFGLRRYLKTIPAEELKRILRDNPDYYFTMAPDAMALGVDRAFARQFGDKKNTACPYLEVEGKSNLTPAQWNEQIRRVVQVLDARQKKVNLQKFFQK